MNKLELVFSLLSKIFDILNQQQIVAMRLVVHFRNYVKC